jgi:hypothetical protein
VPKDSPNRKVSREFSPGGFALRLAAALGLVFATYNPTKWSFIGWLRTTISDDTLNLGPEHLLVGVLLVIGWTIYGAASIRSLGPLGLILGGALLGAIVWLLIDFNVLSAGSAESVVWIVLTCIAALMAIGVSWSHIWRRLTGQFEVDDD